MIFFAPKIGNEGGGERREGKRDGGRGEGM